MTTRRSRVLASALAGFVLMASSLAMAAPSTGTADYVVTLKPGVALEHIPGVEVTQVWEGLGVAAVKATGAGLKALQSKGVQYDKEQTFHTLAAYTDGALTWGLQAVKAQEAWNAGATGTGIKVCILDTGIDYNHPEFVRNGVSIIKGSKNFVADGHPDATDGNHHGTHVAGTIAGQTSNSGSKIGVAPGVDLYIGRVLGDDGSGSTSGILNGVDWCTNTVGAKIISMSLGGSLKSRTEETAYNNAYNKGVLIIAAAGNDGNNRISYPAGYANVVSVAAVDQNLAKASFSQYNSDVELAGPGVATLSSVPLGAGLKSTAQEGSTTYASNPLEFSGMGTVSGQLVSCGIGDTTTSCTNKPASGTWIAVVDRGTINFSDKATNVAAQGASAMLLVNNDTAAPDDAGSFTLGAAGNWIPSVGISYNSGVALKAGGLGTGTVAVTAWDYAYFQGTSMATPHVSAVAALAWSAKPTLTNVQVRSILQTTVKDLGAAGRDVNFGYGLVQADAAVAKAKTY
ncbi:MAG TPA: S8 family serine peptidase [Symbiobacteriaceae bacterium]|nr:S8 family serine peptidase [Symbiobacteriaceae bacterium]